MTLNLVCDISGSMGEGGKPFVLRTLVTTVAQWMRLEYGHAAIKLYAWTAEARHWADWNIIDEFPADMLVCRGAANSMALIQLLGSEPNGKVLILTDGFWKIGDAKALNRWQEDLQPDTLRIIQIGADANPHLSRELKGTKVFNAEDVLAVLDGWLQDDEEWA